MPKKQMTASAYRRITQRLHKYDMASLGLSAKSKRITMRRNDLIGIGGMVDSINR